MRKVTWTDSSGHMRVSMVKDSDPDDMASLGVPVGPPDLEMLDWDAIKKEINNALVQTGMLTWKDVNGSHTGLTVATNVIKRHLTYLYRQQEIEASEEKRRAADKAKAK